MSALRQDGKSAAAFRTISEVAKELGVDQHVLRFWETKFPQVKPLKRGGGRRYYRPEDIELLRRIHDLLREDGFSIRGVQKLLKENGVQAIVKGEEKRPVAPPETDPAQDAKRAKLGEVLRELKEVQGLLQAAR